MIYEYDYCTDKKEPCRDQAVWVSVEGFPQDMEYMGPKWWHFFQDYPQVCADTREELLIHAIQQQKEIIQKAEAEIARLQGMREVQDEPEPDIHFWVGFGDPVRVASWKATIKGKLLWCGDRFAAANMIGLHGKNINIHWIEGWEELRDADFIRAQVVNLRLMNVVNEFIVQL